MKLVEKCVFEERVVKSITREIIINHLPKDIEKVFHLLPTDQYEKITYDITDQ